MFRLRCVSLLLLTHLLVAQATNLQSNLIREETPSSCEDSCSKRTLLSIVWGCLSTTIICAWAAIHPNIPPREGPFKRLLRQVELMLWTIVAPEILPCWALNQRLAAMTVRDIYNEGKGYHEERCGHWMRLKRLFSLYEIAGATNPVWTLKHGHFLIMGGIHLVERVDEDTNSTSSGGTDTDSDGKEGTSGVVSVEPKSGTSSVRADTENGCTPSEIRPKPATILTLQMLRELVKDPAFEISLSEDEIADKSKGNALSKIIFMLQSSWFILQCIARHVQGLSFTQLELTTLALASLNGITFILWWDKPLGANTPVRVYLKRTLTEAERCAGQNQTRTEWYTHSRRSQYVHGVKETFTELLTPIWDILLCRSEANIVVAWVFKLPLCILLLLLFPLFMLGTGFGCTLVDMLKASSFSAHATHVPTFYVPKHRYSEYWHLLLFLILGPTFGAIHCAGWNFSFSTAINQQLWRAASLAVTIIPIGAPIALLLILAIRNFKNAILKSTQFESPTLYDTNSVSRWTTLASTLFYAAARIVLIGLAIALSTNQPPGALIAVDWTKFYPHVQ